jgi:hypothetical protein
MTTRATVISWREVDDLEKDEISTRCRGKLDRRTYKKMVELGSVAPWSWGGVWQAEARGKFFCSSAAAI